MNFSIAVVYTENHLTLLQIIYELDSLALRRVACSLFFLYCIYYREYYVTLSDMVSAAEFPNRLVRYKLKYHLHHLDTWHSTTNQKILWKKNPMKYILFWNKLYFSVILLFKIILKYWSRKKFLLNFNL